MIQQNFLIFRFSLLLQQVNGSKCDFLFEILDSKAKRDCSNNGGLTIDTVKGDLEFQNVSFKYPTRPNIQIFTDLCLSFPSGKVH